VIAALFVLTNGPYFGLPNIDPWDEQRDAKKYAGPYRVIAHPPCERWGRYWSGGPSAKVRRKLGDDQGCFESALNSVRRFGGVLEHPEASHAWKYFRLNRPPRIGGWVNADQYGGMTCCVAQGNYGHKAQKLTWLYAFDCDVFELKWGLTPGLQRLDLGFHSKEERKKAGKQSNVTRLSKRENQETPIEFRNLLIKIVGGK